MGRFSRVTLRKFGEGTDLVLTSVQGDLIISGQL